MKYYAYDPLLLQHTVKRSNFLDTLVKTKTISWRQFFLPVIKTHMMLFEVLEVIVIEAQERNENEASNNQNSYSKNLPQVLEVNISTLFY